MNNTALGIATVAVLGVAALPTQAKTINQTASVSLQPTDITDEVLVPLITKFDTAKGTLNQVIVEFTGQIVTTTGQVESLDAQPQTITANLSGTFSLGGLGGDLFSSPVAATAQKDVTKFDGAIDFADSGSGFVFSGLKGTHTDTVTYTNVDGVFDSFKGNAGEALDTPFTFSALGKATVDSSANVASVIITEASADVSVTYDYTPPTTDIPEPGTLAGLALVSGVIALRRRWMAACTDQTQLSPSWAPVPSTQPRKQGRFLG